jgi:hypothetical protein
VNREPDDPERPREPPASDRTSDAASDRASDRASDVDVAFAQIIAGWPEGRPQWPNTNATDGTADGTAATEETDTADQQPTPPVDEDDDHFVPPEPPPLPRPQPATVGALLLIALGIVLLAIPSMIGFSEQYGLPLGLLSITGAIVWLVARLRQGPPTDSGWDDGAQV